MIAIAGPELVFFFFLAGLGVDGWLTPEPEPDPEPWAVAAVVSAAMRPAATRPEIKIFMRRSPSGFVVL
jgi:hypothetical protein